MYQGILTARDGTLELFCGPIRKVIVSIRVRVSITRSLRLLLGPLELGSCAMGLKVSRVIRRRLDPRPEVVVTIPAVVSTRLVAIATVATGRLRATETITCWTAITLDLSTRSDQYSNLSSAKS